MNEDQSDVMEESSPSEAVEQEAQPEQQEQQQAPAVEQKEENVPFHMHPRFKELVEQKNEFSRRYQDLERRLQDQEQRYQRQLEEMNKRAQPVTETENPVIKRLKGIDPEFADYIKSLEERASRSDKLEDYDRKFQELETRQFTEKAVSKIQTLHSANKVSPELQDAYNREIDSLWQSGKVKTLEDIENAYKASHEKWTKVLDGIKRTERESYVASKKTDAQKPAAQPKGKPAQAPKSEGPLDKASVIAEIMKLNRAQKDI